MSVQMELSRIIISEINDQQVVYLKEVEGDRTFPILIGLFEATSIDRRVKHHQSPRPLTHDLLVASVGGVLRLGIRCDPPPGRSTTALAVPQAARPVVHPEEDGGA